jgi:VanZ family protein
MRSCAYVHDNGFRELKGNGRRTDSEHQRIAECPPSKADKVRDAPQGGPRSQVAFRPDWNHPLDDREPGLRAAIEKASSRDTEAEAMQARVLTKDEARRIVIDVAKPAWLPHLSSELIRLLEPFLRTGGQRIQPITGTRFCGRRSRLDRLWREARGVARQLGVQTGLGWSTEQMSLAVTKSCVRALAMTSLLAILALSLVPGGFRPHTMILPPAFEHVAAYAVAAFFLGLACYHRVPPVQLVLLLTGYGALLELGQLWVPGRHGQLSDIGADLAGASIGVMLALAAMRPRSFALPR